MYCFVSMEIMNSYARIKEDNRIFVYVGICNGIVTKFVTQNLWDFRICVKYDQYDMPFYLDSYGMEILIFEENEQGFYLF